MLADQPPAPIIRPAHVSRGGHATKSARNWRITNHETLPRVIAWGWVASYDPIPTAPKGCIVRYGQNNAAANRMGLESVTWDCP